MLERVLTINIEQKYEGQTIKQILKQQLMISSRLLSRLKIRESAILLNQRPVFVNEILKTGDILTIRLEEQDDQSLGIEPTEGLFTVVYEDDDVLLIDKPPKLSVHPSMGNYYDTLQIICTYI
jgi:23S rRNA pseudouridine1911/1915/1917 synthase